MGNGAGGAADRDQPAAGRQHLEALGIDLTSDHFQDHIHAAACGETQQFLTEVFRAIVNGSVSSQFEEPPTFFFAARGGKDSRPQMLLAIRVAGAPPPPPPEGGTPPPPPFPLPPPTGETGGEKKPGERAPP